MRSAAGSAAAALSAGSVCVSLQIAATFGLATSASFMASTIWSRTMRSCSEGMASVARMAITASTISTSISVKPRFMTRLPARAATTARRAGSSGNR